MDSMVFFGAFCGQVGDCYQINHGPPLLVACVSHLNRESISIRRAQMQPIQSIWRNKKMSALALIATSARAANAVISLYDQYDEPLLEQILAEAEALKARIAIDLITNTKGA